MIESKESQRYLSHIVWFIPQVEILVVVVGGATCAQCACRDSYSFTGDSVTKLFSVATSY